MKKKRTKKGKTKDRKPSAKVTLESVQQSMQDLINNELAELDKWDNRFLSDEPTTEIAASPNIITNRKTTDPASAEAADANAAKPPGKQASTSKQTQTAPPAQAQMADKSLDPNDFSLEIQPTISSGPISEKSQSAKTSEPGSDSNSEQFDDDIPVLHDIAARPAVSSDRGSELPHPGQARELAVRVIAKLNVELRKQGVSGLDPTTVNRLQSILRQELEQQATNMDNTDEH